MEIRQSIFAHIAPELEEVEQRVTGELRLRATDSFGLVQGELGTFGAVLHPALVILSARLFNYRPQPVLALACVLQFIYLATRIHFSPAGKMALPVLVGDLLYTKFFSYLCRHHCLEFLTPLAGVICRMHEGGALRRGGTVRDYPECLEVIDRETALLVREACRTGAKAGEAPSDKVEILGEYGFNLGRAWGLLQEKVPTGAWREFLARARAKLAFLPARPEKRVLEALVDSIAAMAVEAGGLP